MTIVDVSRRHDAEQVVGIAEQPLGLEDLRDRQERVLEPRHRVAIGLVQGGEHEGLEPETSATLRTRNQRVALSLAR
jgi:hypothetical protein